MGTLYKTGLLITELNQGLELAHHHLAKSHLAAWSLFLKTVVYECPVALLMQQALHPVSQQSSSATGIP